MLRLYRGLSLLALAALLITGCNGLKRTDDGELAAPRSPREWAALSAEIRAFQKRIGFEETRNFQSIAGEMTATAFCGHVSRLYLPYSYQDPAIKWESSVSLNDCRELAKTADASYATAEAMGEVETPVTRAILTAPLARLLYVVIHEDCHDQFELPYGVEEALCNVITYNAMAALGRERFTSSLTQYRAIQRFAREGSKHSHLTVAFYERLAALYARHERLELSVEALLKQRERIFRTVEREFARPKGSVNNVGIANDMTYSRHYPLLERVFDALGRDLGRTMAFFRHVDAVKPTAAEVVARHGLKTDEGLEFIRAYEAAVVETIEKALATIRSVTS